MKKKQYLHSTTDHSNTVYKAVTLDRHL